MPAATTASIKWVFQTAYRGGTKDWSTKLHLTGGDWQDQTHYDALSDAIWGDWISAIYPQTTLVETVGYNPGSDLPVFTKSYSAVGTATVPGTSELPLEVCALLRFTTDQRSTKNHPIYLFNYIHDAYAGSGSTKETVQSGMKGHWDTRAAALVAGYSDGTLTRHRAGPRGAVAQSGACETFLTHRDFPR